MTAKNINLPPSPGSFQDFRDAHIELSDGMAWHQYGELTETYRQQLAEHHGISREALHLGQLGIQAEQLRAPEDAFSV